LEKFCSKSHLAHGDFAVTWRPKLVPIIDAEESGQDLAGIAA